MAVCSQFVDKSEYFCGPRAQQSVGNSRVIVNWKVNGLVRQYKICPHQPRWLLAPIFFYVGVNLCEYRMQHLIVSLKTTWLCIIKTNFHHREQCVQSIEVLYYLYGPKSPRLTVFACSKLANCATLHTIVLSAISAGLWYWYSTRSTDGSQVYSGRR